MVYCVEPTGPVWRAGGLIMENRLAYRGEPTGPFMDNRLDHYGEPTGLLRRTDQPIMGNQLARYGELTCPL